MSITSPVTDAASLVPTGLVAGPAIIRPRLQPIKSAITQPAAAHCGVANVESNALNQFCPLARDLFSRLWILDQTAELKSGGSCGRGRLASAARSSSKRFSFILLDSTPPISIERGQRLHPAKFLLPFRKYFLGNPSR